jgi:hypothetical protein
MSGKLPGVELPELNDLREIRNMLAERVKDWRRAWKQEGLEEGQRNGEATLLLRQLEPRFGPLTEADRTRLREAKAAAKIWGHLQGHKFDSRFCVLRNINEIRAD